MKKKTVAIITARGGSKRIPGKNIRDFCGKPIIQYSIQAAFESGVFEEVMVSTDDRKIAEIAIQAGAKVPFMRSEYASGDFASTRDVLLEVLGEYKKIGKEFDYAVCIYPTAPFITGEKLRHALYLMEREECAEVEPVVKFSYPPQRAYVMDERKHLIYKWKEYCNIRSQDLEEFYHDAGQFYCYDIKQYMKGDIVENICPMILPESEVQDIDNEEDWELAEIKYEFMKRKKGYEG